MEFFFKKIKHSDFYINNIDGKHKLLLNNDGFDHFIFHVLSLLTYNISSTCLYCLNEDRYKKKMLEFLSLTNQTIASLFNVFFSIPLDECTKIFKMFKVVVCSRKGLYGADVNLILINYIKHKVIKTLNYLGIMYLKSSQRLYKYFIISMKNTKTASVAFVQSVNTPYVPQHWCAYFYDKTNNCLYFYNSLAQMSQINHLFLKYCRIYLNCYIKLNNYRQQGSSNLCGIYSIYFIVKMNENIENFSMFDKPIQMDPIMNELQLNFIYTKYTSSSPFQNFLDTFYCNFRDPKVLRN